MTPAEYGIEMAKAIKWPSIVFAAYHLGRKLERLGIRLAKAESRLDQLVTRHMPQVHRALAEIRGLLMIRGQE